LFLLAVLKPGLADEVYRVENQACQTVANNDARTNVNVSLSIEDVMDALNGQPDAVLDEAESYFTYAHNNEILGNLYDPGKVALALVEEHQRMGSKPIDFATLVQHTDLSSCIYRPGIVAYGKKRAQEVMQFGFTKDEIEWVSEATGEKLAESVMKDPKGPLASAGLVDALFNRALDASRLEYRTRK
jgi:hypothetical protein